MLDANHLAGFIVSVTTLPFIIILLVIILVLARGASKAGASKRWPVANGRVLSSGVSSHRSLDSDGMHTTIYEPQVVYAYEANGQQYQSSQLNYGAVSGTSSEGWAEGIAAQYPTGNSVQVFYNPTNPADAVLEHSGAGGSLALMFVLLVVELILVGLLILGVTGHMG